MQIEDDILCYDFQGWPVWKMNLLEIIRDSGLFKYDEENKRYYIDESDPKLKIYPRTLEDDGMSYGVNEKYISEVSLVSMSDGKDDLINVFIEPKTYGKEKETENHF